MTDQQFVHKFLDYSLSSSGHDISLKIMERVFVNIIKPFLPPSCYFRLRFKVKYEIQTSVRLKISSSVKCVCVCVCVCVGWEISK